MDLDVEKLQKMQEIAKAAMSGLSLEGFKGDVVGFKYVENEFGNIEEGGIGVQYIHHHNVQEQQDGDKDCGKSLSTDAGKGNVQQIPPELENTEAQRLLHIAQEKGWLDENYQPKGLKKVQMALLAGRISNLLWNENRWGAFEQLWGQRKLADSFSDGLCSKKQEKYWDELVKVIK